MMQVPNNNCDRFVTSMNQTSAYNKILLTKNVGNPNPTEYKTLDEIVDSLNGYRIDSSLQKNPL